MMNSSRGPEPEGEVRPVPTGEETRTGTRLAALAGLTLLGIFLCAYLAYPFLPALAWALALAVMAFPLHARLDRALPNGNWAAGVSTAVVVLVVLVPILLVAGQLAREAAVAGSRAKAMARNGQMAELIDRVPYLRQGIDWVWANYDLEAEARNFLARIAGNATALAQGSAWFAVQVLVCVFVLFFAFRDWRHLLGALGDLSPLSRDEADYLYTRVADAIHATVYATVVTSVIQGVMGGLLFWVLGLPAPVLWGTVMVVLGILPIVGAVLVWLPAAVVLALNDRWGAAVGLVAWGVLMAGPITNFIYAHLAGGRMRLHPVPVLISFVGGLAVFGVSGMVLGPSILAVTLGLIDVWRRRTGNPAASELPAGPTPVVPDTSAAEARHHAKPLEPLEPLGTARI